MILYYQTTTKNCIILIYNKQSTKIKKNIKVNEAQFLAVFLQAYIIQPYLLQKKKLRKQKDGVDS